MKNKKITKKQIDMIFKLVKGKDLTAEAVRKLLNKEEKKNGRHKA